MSTANERVRYIRKELKMTTKQFGEQLGVTRASISNIENGYRNLTRQMANAISNHFDVSEEWLLTGEGEPFKAANRNMPPQVDFEDRLDKVEEAIIREYLNLRDEERKVFRRFLKNVIYEIVTDDFDKSDQHKKQVSISDNTADTNQSEEEIIDDYS